MNVLRNKILTLSHKIKQNAYQYNLVDRNIALDYSKHSNQHFFHTDRVDKVQALQQELHIVGMDYQLEALDMSKLDCEMNHTQHLQRNIV